MRTILSAALAASLSVAAAPAFAQDTAPADAAPQTFELTDEQVADFVEAARGINALTQELQSEFEAAETDAERQSIQQGAQAQLTEIVTDTGLTVVEYNAIANAARSNESVANRIRNAAMASQGAQ
ncbi:DUF4168 domain-containing protein [Maricaulis alexandrii]|uniref:DUF4168 domain-containing protein n=1 Tax=Maricaulis alexandrii TaxID=2570354 RepID=UPI001485EA24|nr:DUF4168 domain-containing protein [Maricaulis alexandrii]